MFTNINFQDLIGQTLTEVYQTKDEKTGQDEIHFKTPTKHYRLTHFQDCCEHVYIKDVNGDYDDLIGTPIIKAEVSTVDMLGGEVTATFYLLATNKGYVNIAWSGESSGYYSQAVYFERIE